METEIILPELKPELEWINGRAIQKVSPARPHALLQLALGTMLRAWAEDRGEVGTEWRFRLQPPGEPIRPLVPDVAYLSYARMGDADDAALASPLMAPDVAVEIRSPDDRETDLEHKIGVYLACGCEAIVVVDPDSRSIDVFDRSGALSFVGGDVMTHPALPGFTLRLPDLFAVLERPRRR